MSRLRKPVLLWQAEPNPPAGLGESSKTELRPGKAQSFRMICGRSVNGTVPILRVRTNRLDAWRVLLPSPLSPSHPQVVGILAYVTTA